MQASYTPIAKGLLTKYENEMIKQVSLSTASKMVPALMLDDNMVPGQILEDKLKDVLKDNLPEIGFGGGSGKRS